MYVKHFKKPLNMGKCSMFLILKKKALLLFCCENFNCFDFEALLSSVWTGTYYLEQSILKFIAIYL